ncbi:hypothetical protein N0V85_009586 [Neurospora sp. IMI 360204]|nr:hypothetical protein N0V85_009586 [Neurospora sp. IMI 360204]
MKLSNALTSGALVAHAAAATSGDLTILTMNVAGLPAILNPNGVPGGKKASAKTIGSKAWRAQLSDADKHHNV